MPLLLTLLCVSASTDGRPKVTRPKTSKPVWPHYQDGEAQNCRHELATLRSGLDGLGRGERRCRVEGQRHCHHQSRRRARKIDHLLAAFNTVALMTLDHEASRRQFYSVIFLANDLQMSERQAAIEPFQEWLGQGGLYEQACRNSGRPGIAGGHRL